MGDKIVNSFFLNPVQETEIIKIIKNLNSNKSLGPNSTPVHILKENIEILAKPLLHIINVSFSEGIFPESLKTARVTPIYKKNDPQQSSNYRPISVLSVFSKLFEKCIYSRLYSLLTKYKLIFKRQFGFRTKYSTNHALISLIGFIKSNLDKDLFVCGIFIDLQKAFETVNHEILLKKLEHYEIRGTTNNWLRSFLTNRTQYVYLSGYNSSVKTIICGVPQGSTLRSLLFLVYINDMHKAFSKSIIHHFADDTNMSYAGKNIKTIESVVNYELKILVDWLRSNKLSLNESKTEMIIFRPPKKDLSEMPNIKINNFKLSVSPDVTYLGVTIDEVLSLNKQIDNICQKLGRANGIMSKLRHFVPLHVCIMVYYSIFYCYLLYGCIVWSFTNQGNKNRLSKLQKSCVRLLTFSEYRAHTDPLFAKLNLIKVEDIFSTQKILFMFETLHDEIPEELKRIFTLNDTLYDKETRSRHLFHIPKAKTTRFGLNTIRFDGPKLWNEFCAQILSEKNTQSKPLLKKRLTEYYIKTYRSNESLL